MNRILVIAEHDGRRLAEATARAVACAQAIGGEITVAVLGAEVAEPARAAASLAGVAHVLTFAAPANAHALAAVQAPQLAAVAVSFSHVLAPSTTFGKDLLPRLAALLDVPALSDVMAVETATRFRRPIYAGNAIVTIEAGELRPILATVRLASFEAVATGAAAAAIEAVAVPPELPAHTRFISVTSQDSGRPDLATARRVVSGGRALGSAEKFQLVHELAAVLGAAVGASRAAVDAGYAPNDLQVGQTGKIIAPQLYVALGISGAIQHMTGIKDARAIVAINKDPDAPIFEAADYGLVADLFEAVPQLIAELRSRGR
ncbi:MAG TPA: electron transfer flavoprotein subunit alpha/FixB family protein [Steroidobacteraceae bacterium]|nr:electron transfer flavoprotein subunit alpha/FixB family protein [Steroidobacteraceae bacterium]